MPTFKSIAYTYAEHGVLFQHLQLHLKVNPRLEPRTPCLPKHRLSTQHLVCLLPFLILTSSLYKLIHFHITLPVRLLLYKHSPVISHNYLMKTPNLLSKLLRQFLLSKFDLLPLVLRLASYDLLNHYFLLFFLIQQCLPTVSYTHTILENYYVPL